MRIASHPATHGRPSPRATTAAWLVAPHRLRLVGIEHDVARRRAGRGVEALRQIPALRPREGFRGLVEPREEELLDVRGLDPEDRLLLRDQTFRHHVHRGLHRGLPRPLSPPPPSPPPPSP